MRNFTTTHGVFAPVLFLICLLLNSCASTGPTPPAAKVKPRQQIDLIIEGDYIVSMETDGVVYEDSAIAVDHGIIVAIGPRGEITSNYQSANTLQGENKIVMPGLINGHSHAAMTLLRGVAARPA